MSITVKQISTMTLKNKDIDVIIKEQLQIIDEKIIQTDKSIGKNFILHNLPNMFPSIPNINKIDLQRIVYSSIITSLKNRGFDIKIVLDNNISIIYIEWKTELEEESLNIMNSIIKTNRINKEELDKIIQFKHSK
jgi:hypothetical protein